MSPRYYIDGPETGQGLHAYETREQAQAACVGDQVPRRCDGKTDDPEPTAERDGALVADLTAEAPSPADRRRLSKPKRRR